MNFEQLQSSKEYNALSRAEKEFVSKFVETGDLDVSTLAAYPSATSQSLRTLQWRMKNSKRVRAALAAFGKDSADVTMAALDSTLQEQRDR
ncbi:MAG TPA: hypothetical protein VN807_07725, partial [Candidatus Sulfotelmatobacter sp.]|nr:hypothetical protein [Candidatus Sulfotelmatobacter sp.]